MKRRNFLQIMTHPVDKRSNEVSEQEYNKAVKAAVEGTGPSEADTSGRNWNTRFLANLASHGLKLKYYREGQGCGYYVEAPLPVPDQMPSWSRCLIVPLGNCNETT